MATAGYCTPACQRLSRLAHAFLEELLLIGADGAATTEGEAMQRARERTGAKGKPPTAAYYASIVQKNPNFREALRGHRREMLLTHREDIDQMVRRMVVVATKSAADLLTNGYKLKGLDQLTDEEKLLICGVVEGKRGMVPKVIPPQAAWKVLAELYDLNPPQRIEITSRPVSELTDEELWQDIEARQG